MPKSGSLRSYSSSPHTTPHAGPHEAVQLVVKCVPWRSTDKPWAFRRLLDNANCMPAVFELRHWPFLLLPHLTAKCHEGQTMVSSHWTTGYPRTSLSFRKRK